MKIVQCLGWYFPNNLGGTEVYVDALSRRLVEVGHTVWVSAPDPTLAAPREYTHNDIPVFRYPVPSAPSRNECQGIEAVRGSEVFIAWLRRMRPDVLHVHAFVTGMGLHEIAAAKDLGIRVVVTTHSSSLGFICQRGTMMQWGQRPCDGILATRKCAACSLHNSGMPKHLALVTASIPPPIARVLGRIPGSVGTALGLSCQIRTNAARQREMLHLVDRFVVLTKWALDAVIANGGPPGRVCLNRLGVSQPGILRKSSPKARPTGAPLRFGYLGRIDLIKGVEVLAHAFRSIGVHVPVELEFRGPRVTQSERSAHDRLREILRGDGRASFAEPVPPASVAEVLSHYDVLVCPSVCLEGGPTVAIEAHSVGTPVIGSDIGGLSELIKDGYNGRLLPPGDSDALARCMIEVAENPGKTVDVWRERLPLPRTIAEIVNDYNELYVSMTGDE